MSILHVHRFFIMVTCMLALPCWAAGQETYTGNNRVMIMTTVDMDINFTVADACQFLGQFLCIQSATEKVYMHAGMCLTSSSGVFGLCPYFPKDIDYSNSWLRFSAYYILPSNRTLREHSKLTCGPYNREGLLCSKCKPGYGPAVYSFSLMCAECSDNGVGWALYLFVVLFPITVFYIIVIIFNIRATAPPFTAFVLMCQVYSTINLV